MLEAAEKHESESTLKNLSKTVLCSNIHDWSWNINVFMLLIVFYPMGITDPVREVELQRQAKFSTQICGDFMRKISGFLIALVTVLSCHAQTAINFPEHSIKLIVPYPPGGSTDPAARMLANSAKTYLGQAMVVENISGGGGSIGTSALVRAPADGYTLLLHTSTIATDPTLKKNISYDVKRDLSPVTLAVSGDYLLVAHPSVPFKNIAELIAYAKANPGKLNYGTAGPGTGAHLAAEMFMKSAGIQMTHIPYKGSGPALHALIANETQLQFDTLSGSRSFVETGRLRALAVTGQQRSSLMPNIPTISESGLKDFSLSYWLGIFAPAKTPLPVIEKLHRAFKSALAEPQVVAKMVEMGSVPLALAPADFAKVFDDDIARFRSIIVSAKITID